MGPRTLSWQHTMNPLENQPPKARPQCPVCKSFDVQALCQVDGYDVWRCAESATDFVWPLPSPADLKQLYDREAWFEGSERGGYSDYDAQTAPSLQLVTELLRRFPSDKTDLCVLDVGCGYGSHLKIAADQGWQCFGIETSAHARSVIEQRYGNGMTIVERAEDLLPKRFDLVLMFELIEHLADPYHLFFTLFGRDAIGPDTLVVISTPNARSHDAIQTPAQWAYRHPPSHLTFYSAHALHQLLSRLLFKEITVEGIVPMGTTGPGGYADEAHPLNDDKMADMGLLAYGKGSTFKSFMHERYVPGAFWKLTEYEHFPRYALAALLAPGQRALDFGCGTGYGTAQLAHVASSVTGLDISPEAIAWARATHRDPKISFDLRTDLGAGLDQGSFDLITCFEMIEHVDHATQISAIRSISSLLATSGKLVISTPDPKFTAPYGHNPYHLREMTEPQFRELLSEGFKHITILKQWVRPSVFIGTDALASVKPAQFGRLDDADTGNAPVGFIAICSNEAFETPPTFVQFDTSADFNWQTLETEHKLNRLRFQRFELSQRNVQMAKEEARLIQASADLNQRIEQEARAHATVKEELSLHIQAHKEAVQWFEREIQGHLAAKDWLAGEREAWEKLAQERESAIHAQDASIATALQANEWLLTQRDAWQYSSQAEQAQKDTLQLEKDTLQLEKNTLQAKLNHISGHKLVRLVNFLLRGKLL